HVSIRPGPDGPGKRDGCRVIHIGGKFQSAPVPMDRGNSSARATASPSSSFNPPRSRWTGETRSLQRQHRAHSVSIRPGPDGPGKRERRGPTPRAVIVSIRPGPDGPGKLVGAVGADAAAV